MGIIRNLQSRFSMRKKSVLFWDIVNGRPVFRYVDKFGDEWLAQHKFGTRVKRKRYEG